MKQLEKALDMSDENINLLLIDEELIQLKFSSESNNENYLVSCLNGYWRCQCVDYNIHGLHIDDSSYTCKHIIKAIQYLAQVREVELSDVQVIKELNDA